MNEKLLKKLYSINSPSGKEIDMENFLTEFVSRISGVNFWSDKRGNIYAEKRGSEIGSEFPCIVAHLDEVHTRDFGCHYSTQRVGGILFGFDLSTDSFVGCGADDKNGIFIALSCLEKYDHIKVAFFVEEEIGCRGSSAADMSFFKDCRFVIQADRRNGSDFISKASFVDLCSAEFIADVNMAKFGYKEAAGIMTDVLTLKENGLEVSCCNLSCGYYNPHTENEYTKISELKNCLDFVQSIIEGCTKVYKHNYEKWGYNSYGKWGYKETDWGLDESKYLDFLDSDLDESDEPEYLDYDKTYNKVVAFIMKLYYENKDINIDVLIHEFPLVDFYIINSAYEEVMGEPICF
jgi:tripeptide aminopeptidase